MSPDSNVDPSEAFIAPSKPARPLRPAFGTREPRPEPIEVDDAEIIEPNPGPDPEEVQPTAGPSFLPATTPPPERTAFEALGEAAASNAALNAGGAPTPLAGVPMVDAAPETTVDLSDGEPAFQPRLEGSAADQAQRPDPASLTGLEAGLASSLQQAGEAYVPRAATGEEPPTEQTSTSPTQARRPGRAWPLVAVGLVTMAGLGYGAYLALGTPEEIELPPQQVVAEKTEVALDPIALDNPTPFLAALPATAGLWAMTAAETLDPENVNGVPGRIAEAQSLTYGDGTSEVTMRALQFYGTDQAQASLTELADDATLTPHTVGGNEVGAEGTWPNDAGVTTAWTNGSALFLVSGSEADVAQIVSHLGL